jgi:Asp-tRNA(Asn)/Glu-tRNA(Gln) amidotransferase B subunit
MSLKILMKFVRRYSYQPTIGLEVHARMVARQKLFSKASAMTNSPNKNVDLFDAAIPGTLPVLFVD